MSKGLIAALIGAGVIFLFIASLLSGGATKFVSLGILIAIILAICAASFTFSLPGRRITLVFMGLAAFSLVLALFLGDVFYAVLLKVLNSFTDPAQREFLPDYEKLVGVRLSTNSGRGAEVLNFLAYIPFTLGIVVAASGVALKLLGWPRTPAAFPAAASQAAGAPAQPFSLGQLGRADKVGLLMASVGLVLTLGGQLPQIILNEALKEGVDYTTGGGINEGAAWLFWPMMVLSKVWFIGAVSLFCGAVVLAVGGPRRRAALFGWLRKRAWASPETASWVMSILPHLVRHWGSSPKLALLNYLGLAMIVIGVVMYVIELHLLENFLILTIREIGIIATGDFLFFADPEKHPGWLKTIMTIAGLWALPTFTGTVILAVGSRIGRMIIKIVVVIIKFIDSLIPEPPPSSSGGGGSSSGSGGSSSSRSDSSPSGGASRASRRAGR